MNLGARQPAIPPEEFFLAMNHALKDAFASLQSELQNVIHDAFEQLRLTTPTLASLRRRLEHSSTPISHPEVEIVHSHLWKARCKQVALTSTAATGGVKKPHSFGLGASTIHKIAKYQKRSSAASLLLDDAISAQSNHNPTSLGLVSGTGSSVPKLNFVNNGCGSTDYVPGAMLYGVDMLIFDNEKRSFDMSVMDKGDGKNLSEHEGIGVKLDGMQGPYSGECHALKVFDKTSKSDGFCGSRVAALTNIRDKGGGIKTHRDCNVSLMSTEGCGSNCSGNILQSQGFSKSSLRAGGLFQAISFKKKCTLRGSRAFHKLENDLRAELNIRHVKGCYYVKVETSISVGYDEQRGKMIAAIMDRSEHDGLLPIQSSSSIETMGKVEEAWEVDIPYCSTQFVTNSEELTAEFENAEVLITYRNIPAIKDSTIVPISSVMGCSSEGNGHFSTKTDEQGLNLCEKNATYLFDEVLQSNWLCNAGKKMAAYMGIRDKGGGLTTHFETFDATHVSIKASFQLPDKEISGLVTSKLYCKPSWESKELHSNVATKPVSEHNDILIMSCSRSPNGMVEPMNGGGDSSVDKKVFYMPYCLYTIFGDIKLTSLLENTNDGGIVDLCCSMFRDWLNLEYKTKGHEDFRMLVPSLLLKNDELISNPFYMVLSYFYEHKRADGEYSGKKLNSWLLKSDLVSITRHSTTVRLASIAKEVCYFEEIPAIKRFQSATIETLLDEILGDNADNGMVIHFVQEIKNKRDASEQEKYFCVLLQWHNVKWNPLVDGDNELKCGDNMVDAFLYALVDGDKHPPLLLPYVIVFVMGEVFTRLKLLQHEYHTDLVDVTAIATFHLHLNEAAEVYKKLMTGSAYEFGKMWKRGTDSSFFNGTDHMSFSSSPHREYTLQSSVEYDIPVNSVLARSSQLPCLWCSWPNPPVENAHVNSEEEIFVHNLVFQCSAALVYGFSSKEMHQTGFMLFELGSMKLGLNTEVVLKACDSVNKVTCATESETFLDTERKIGHQCRICSYVEEFLVLDTTREFLREVANVHG